MISSSSYSSFKKLVGVTIISVYFLILVGGIVRSTGSGMGCPDWPKCFGKWVPPTSQSELPENYKEIYSQKRKLKNFRIAEYLRMFDFKLLANKIEGDSSYYTEMDFNPVKTWIEYLNRLVGVTIGLLIFAVFVSSIKFYSVDKLIPFLSFISFILVGFEGWLGSIVVSTNLLPFTITIHMGLALLLILVLIYLFVRIKDETYNRRLQFPYLKPLLLFSIFITFIQIIIGTQVREEIDIISKGFNFLFRELWIEKLSEIFIFHRSFSIFIVILNLLIIVLYYKHKNEGSLNNWFLILAVIIISEILIGIFISYFSIPSYLQPFHLLLGCLMFGIQIFIFFNMPPSTKSLS